MLVASVAFDLTHIFTLVFTSLLYQKVGIEKTIVSTVYYGDKIQSGDNYLLPGIAEITWRQAENSCFHQKPKYLLFDSLGHYSWNALLAHLRLHFVQNL
jgi:hypothetical protein